MPPPIHHRLNLGCGLVNKCTPIRSGRASERILSVPFLEYWEKERHAPSYCRDFGVYTHPLVPVCLDYVCNAMDARAPSQRPSLFLLRTVTHLTPACNPRYHPKDHYLLSSVVYFPVPLHLRVHVRTIARRVTETRESQGCTFDSCLIARPLDRGNRRASRLGLSLPFESCLCPFS